MSEELKPCPFCGKPPRVGIYSEGGIDCPSLPQGDFSLEEWNNAYCWKENKALSEKLAGYEKAGLELAVELVHRETKIEALEKELATVKQQLADGTNNLIKEVEFKKQTIIRLTNIKEAFEKKLAEKDERIKEVGLGIKNWLQGYDSSDVPFCAKDTLWEFLEKIEIYPIAKPAPSPEASQ